MAAQLEATYFIISGASSARRMPAVIDQLAPRVPSPIAVLSEHATRILSPRELVLIEGVSVVESYFDEVILPRPPDGLVLVAPCTFNSLNKLATGIADTLALSIGAEAIGRGTPVIVAPSVNDSLWAHPRTRQSIEVLLSWNVTVIPPVPDEDGRLTMAPDTTLIDAVLAAHRQEEG
ncbi:MAG: flavoprotein [Chloroflexota bacterium]